MAGATPLAPYFYIPETISKEAQAYLRTAIPVGGPIKNNEEFKAIRKSFAEYSKADHNKAMTAHVTEIKKNLFAGRLFWWGSRAIDPIKSSR